MSDDFASRFAPDEPAPAKPVAPGAPRMADWRASDTDPRRSRKVMAAVTLLVLLGLAGLIVGIVVNWVKSEPEPRFISVPVGEYSHTAWPVNPWADADARMLADCFPERRGQTTAAATFTYQEQAKLRGLLAWVAGTADTAEGGLDEAAAARPLVLHVTALAAARGDRVYLLPADARPGDLASWVPVDDLLDAMRDCKATGKLLILDLGHTATDAFGGALWDDAMTRLDERLQTRQKENNLPFPVLTSCGPGETSLPADPEKCSGFAFYLAEGLHGWADGYQENRTDSRDRDELVSVPELARFTAHRVARWALVAHDRTQNPKLYGSLDQAPRFSVRKDRRTQRELPGAPEAYPDSLRAGWQFREQQIKEGGDRGLPDPFARLTARLLRAEEVWLRSGNAARAGDECGRAQTDWKSARPPSGGADPAADVSEAAVRQMASYRLAVAVAHARTYGRRPPPPADWGNALDDYLRARYALATAAKTDDPQKVKELKEARDEWLKKVQPDKDPPARLDAAWLIWERAVETRGPTQDWVEVWLEALDDLKLRQTYSEVLLLRSLAGWEFRRQGLSEYPGAAVAALLRAEHEQSQLLGQGSDGFALVRERLKGAEAARRDGQQRLTGRFDAVVQSGGRLNEAASNFAAARGALARYQEGQRRFAEAVGIVIDTLPAALLTPRDGDFDTWLAAASKTAELGDLVAPAGRERTLDADAIEGLGGEVQRMTRQLREPFAPAEVERLVKSGPRTSPGDLLPLQRLVAGPTIPADARKQVREALRADAVRLHEAARQHDRGEDEGEVQTKPVSRAAEVGRVPDPKLAVRRAMASLALLAVAGYDRVGEVEPMVKQFAGDPTLTRAHELAERLRLAWVTHLPQQLANASTSQRWHEADRITRTTPPALTAHVVRPVGKPEELPAVRQAAADARSYQGWARGRLDEDAAHPRRSKAPGADAFYLSAQDLSPD